MREDWKETTLGELCSITKGTSPTEKTQPGAFPLVVTAAARRSSSAFQFDGPAVCIPTVSSTGHGHASLKRVHYQDGQFALANIMLALQVSKPEFADTKFLWFLLDHQRGQLLVPLMRGTANMSFGIKDLSIVKLLLPPLAEQKRIVDVIEAVDAYVAALESYANAARTARAALLHELLTTNTKGWKETTLGEVADVVGGGTPSTTRAEFWDGDIVWLTPTEVVALDGRRVSDSERKITKQGLANSGARLLPKGTVILTSRASVGFAAVSDCELCTNQGFQSLIPRTQILAEFLLPWVQTNRSEFMARSAGSTFKEISKTNVATMRILLPPLTEQKRIVDVIGSVDGAVAGADRAAEDARNLRSGLLSDLLSGDHGIPESYDELLGAA